MSTRITATCVLLLVTFQHATAQEVAVTEVDSSAAKIPAAPHGWVLIREVDWIRLNDEPSRLMQQAHESFLKRNFDEAAADLRKVAGYLNAAASHGTKDVQQSLKASGAEINRLAKEIESGAEKSPEASNKAFIRAEYALARYHNNESKRKLGSKDQGGAASYLTAAVRNVENVAKWSGNKLEEGSLASLDFAREACGAVVHGAGNGIDELGKGVEYVGREIEKLGNEIRPDATPLSGK